MDEQLESIEAICKNEFKRRALDVSLGPRLNDELREILVQSEEDYLLDLHRRGMKFAVNENNLLVAYLLGLVDSFDAIKPPKHIDGDYPDIDVDWLPEIQQHLKTDWAPRIFGEENVCSVGTYGTLGIKMALKDVTRVFGIPKDEVEIICKNIPIKDDDGNELEWDKALEICPDLKDYCSRYPEIAEAVKTLIHRRKSGGVHAGGLIISSKPIADFVPLEVRSVKKENKYGIVASAWSEGLHSQDLGAVGLVKFDLLVVDGLQQIAIACKLIKERYGIEHICAKPGQRNWSDTSYLNDPLALAIARKGDTKCVFQFGSEGIRYMVRKGGVTSFNDIVAYSALYRPSAMSVDMHTTYCKRKQGEEKYTLHPLVRPILKTTYGVMVFQEQCTRILNVVGGINEQHCELVRKAISKKKLSEFAKYEVMFLKNAQKNLGVDEEYVKNLWDQIVSFAGYGFNLSHSVAYSYITARQLWLMAYYPLEFYTAMLMCEKDYAKIKEIKIDAALHGIEVAPIHINKSKANFSIRVDDDGKEKIFYGFSNLQHVGEGPAQRIIEGQPYNSFEDFLHRFGADGATIKALVSINAFKGFQEKNRLKLFKFAEHWKDWHNKQDASKNRFGESLIRHEDSLKTLLEEYQDVVQKSADPTDYDKMVRFTEEAYELWEKYFSEIEEEEFYNYKGEVRSRTITVLQKFQVVRRRRDNCISGRATKERSEAPTLADFEPLRSRVKIKPEIEELMTGDTGQAEKNYYGYQWVHIIEKAKYYEGFTIDKFIADQKDVGCIEVMLQKVDRLKSKKSDTHYYVLHVEDANSREVLITMWEDDHERFKDDLKPGNLLKIRVTPPEGKWSKWTFETVPRHLRRNLPRKDDDNRLYVMSLPAVTQKPVQPRSDAAILLEDL